MVFWRRPKEIQLAEQKNNFQKPLLIFYLWSYRTTTNSHSYYLFIYCTIFLIFCTHNASAAAEMVVTCISSVYTNPACCLPFDGCCTRWSMTGLEIHLFEHSNHMLRREREAPENWEILRRRVGILPIDVDLMRWYVCL